jgi:CBS domain containing-hemolysin-like protein
MWPLVKMAEFLTRVMTRNRPKKSVHRDEFIALAELGTKEGIFHKYESRVLQNLFYLRDIRTKDIMTPRTVVFALHEEMSAEQVMAESGRIYFSRIPVYGDDLDDIRGFVLKTEIFRTAQEKPETPLKDMLRPLVVVRDDLNLHELFELMMKDSLHIALVVDEYGGTEGVVTLEDFIETLLGLEIVDEVDRVEDMQEIARRQWELRAQRVGLLTDNLKIEPPEG